MREKTVEEKLKDLEYQQQIEREGRRKKEQHSNDFATSAIIGAVTDSAIIGGLVGGDMLGGIVGDLFNGGSLDD